MNGNVSAFDHMCRLCLGFRTEQQTSSMADEAFRSKLDAVCHFTFATNDQLPSKICSQCSSKVLEYYQFVHTVQSNQEKLLSMLSINVPIKLEEPIKNEIYVAVVYEDETCPAVKQEVCNDEDTVNEMEADLETPANNENSHESDSSEKVPDPADEDRLIKQYFALSCDSCSTEFESYKELSHHTKESHNRKPTFQCCNKTFQARHKMLLHIKTHLKPFKCDICGKTYSYLQALRLHARSHLASEDKPFKCDKCPCSFTKDFMLRTHQKLHDRVECSICKKTFANVYIMKNHVKTYHSEQQTKFICDVCGKEFNSKRQVQAHRIIHTVPTLEDGARCEICHTWISRKSRLRRHMVDIHQSKESECDICHKVYRNMKALKKHKKLVHVELSFECDICGKRFKRKLNLTEHVASAHTGQKLYSCEFCGMEMNSNGNLYSHKKNKHPLEWAEAKLKAGKMVDV